MKDIETKDLLPAKSEGLVMRKVDLVDCYEPEGIQTQELQIRNAMLC